MPPPRLPARCSPSSVPSWTCPAASRPRRSRRPSRPWPGRHEDASDLPLVTIDPPGAKDLDQAMFLERDGDGYVVHYAIADPASFVTPGGALDAALADRGVTFYGPDSSITLHPKVLSAGAADMMGGP